MPWFELDPHSIAARLRTRGPAENLPSLGRSLATGIAGFTLLGVAGFAPWALGAAWFRGRGGEGGMYAACALVFIGLSSPLLHRLIPGPGSVGRFYRLFGSTFAAYSVAWIAGWMLLGGHPGSIAGLLAGTALMGWMLCRAFDAPEQLARVIAALFLLNSAGYFAGGLAEAALAGWKGISWFGAPIPRRTRLLLAMFSWGVCYGAGFGAGLGIALHACQGQARELLAGGRLGEAGAAERPPGRPGTTPGN
ncbi:MAG TPA: hypothetical protein DCM86_12035 [Verrucomicrobiales bacterium]|nr:hypothetical protein [Verrucomicrobiales bacterium]